MCYTYFSDLESHRKLNNIKHLTIKIGSADIDTRGDSQIVGFYPLDADNLIRTYKGILYQVK
jgi:superfamily II helicase